MWERGWGQTWQRVHGEMTTVAHKGENKVGNYILQQIFVFAREQFLSSTLRSALHILAYCHFFQYLNMCLSLKKVFTFCNKTSSWLNICKTIHSKQRICLEQQPYFLFCFIRQDFDWPVLDRHLIRTINSKLLYLSQ